MKTTMEQIKKFEEDLKALTEGAPVGSLEYLQNTLRDALRKVSLFPDSSNYCYIMYVFLDKVILSCGEKTFSVSYSINNSGAVAFGKPVEVEQHYSTKESELHESNIERTVDAVEKDFEIDFASIREGSYNEETGDVEVVLIEAGTNKEKKRHYPKSTIQEAASSFAGLKMYINHPTKTDEQQRPERDLRDWASTITESRYEDGKAIGKVSVHDAWLKERLKDPIARAHIGLSINTSGKISMGKIDGEEMQIVEKIVLKRQNGPASVDWVTEAGARGRVSKLLRESITQEEEMNFKELNLETLQKERPDLVEAARGTKPAPVEESAELKEAKAENARLKKENAIRDQREKVVTQLKESKLPEAAKNRVIDVVMVTLHEADKLQAVVEAAAKSELDYISKFSTKGKIVTTSTETTKEKGLKESIVDEISGSLGLKDEAPAAK